jgi:deoxyadenosine/deoxycytidine kinase
MSKHFIAVAGNIGAGKSTLTRLLAERCGWTPFYEANAENPYLADFYADMARWSFHSQVFFLGRRLEHHYQLLQQDGVVLQDRTVYEDAEIFARNLHAQGMMSDRDYNTYWRLYKAVAAFLPPPSLIVYLQADVETLLTHIRKRGREYERHINPDYLARLNHLYDEWINDWTLCPILKFDMTELDFEYNSQDLDCVVAQVQAALLIEE